jgi:hypothetical protein
MVVLSVVDQGWIRYGWQRTSRKIPADPPQGTTMALVDRSIVIRRSDPDEFERRKEKFLEALRSGAHFSTAAAYAGITTRSVSRWVQEGRKLREILDQVVENGEVGREPSPSELELIWLAEAVDRTEAEAEVNLLMTIRNAANGEEGFVGDWRPASFILERRFKDRWARRTEATGAEGGPVQVEDLGVVRERMAEALASIHEKLASAEAAVLGDGRGGEIEVEAEVVRD